MGDQPALGRGERGVCGIAQDLALANTVLGGEPVPHRDIERGAGRVAKILYTIAAIDRELHRIDAVGEVESKIGKISGAGGGYIAGC